MPSKHYVLAIMVVAVVSREVTESSVWPFLFLRELLIDIELFIFLTAL